MKNDDDYWIEPRPLKLIGCTFAIIAVLTGILLFGSELVRRSIGLHPEVNLVETGLQVWLYSYAAWASFALAKAREDS